MTTARLPFDVKICGVTRGEDLRALVAANVPAIGLNFYPRSRRYLGEPQASEIRKTLRELPRRPVLVGVFVNAEPSEIRDAVTRFDLDWVQLHGQEPPEFGRALPGLRVLRALPYGEGGLAEVIRFLEAMEAAGCLPDAVLLDAQEAGAFGGTGLTLPWQRLADDLAAQGGCRSGRIAMPRRIQEADAATGDATPGLPWVLAGGLHAANVAEAIGALHPQAVDVASGVESEPGRKDAEKTRQFLAAARSVSSR